MTFINKKEETFDLIMTEKGRKKLSRGKFKPYSYSFYDNEIIYDHAYTALSASLGEVTELQNEANPRIKKTLMTQEKITWDDSKKDSEQKDPLNYPTYFELGSYDYTQQYKPAWKIYVQEGEITGAIKQYPIELEKAGKITDIFGVTALDGYRHDKIPQLNVFCEYQIYEKKVGNKIEVYVDRKSDDLKFIVGEENVFDDKENFILEVFQFSNEMTRLKKLEFVNEKDALTPNHVEHFFNITTDTDDNLSINYSDTLVKLEKGLEDECK